MKKLICNLLSVALIFVLGVFTISCGGGSSSSSEIRISGSTSVAPMISELAAAFEAENPQYIVIIESVGSSVGISDTINNNNDIGMASRNIKPEEAESVDTTVLCNDGIVLIVNNASTLEEINSSQLLNLYMNNVAIADVSKSISREDGSGTRGAFTELTGVGEDSPLPATVEILDGTGKVKTAVANDVNKLGYISLGSLDNTVKGLKYSNGGEYVQASVANIQNGSYPLFRPFNLVTKKGETLSEATLAFLAFCATPEAMNLIAENGYIPL